MKDSDNYHGESGLDGEHHEDDAGSITLSPKPLNPKPYSTADSMIASGFGIQHGLFRSTAAGGPIEGRPLPCGRSPESQHGSFLI